MSFIDIKRYKCLTLILINFALINVNNAYADGAGSEAKFVNNMLLYKAECDREIAGYMEKSYFAYQKWRKANKGLIDQVEPNVKRHIASVYEKGEIPPLSDDQKIEFQVFCDNLTTQFENIAKVADKRFSTPEKAWKLFIGALTVANKEAAIECLTSDMQEKFKPMITKMTGEQLTKMAESFVTFTLLKSSADSKYREAAISRENNQAGIIVFYDVYGEWKIAEM